MFNRINTFLKSRIKLELINKIGKDKIFEEGELIDFYSEDYTEHPISPPDYVVKASNIDDIEETLQIARKFRISVIPALQNTNIGGLCIPEKGGIILDLRNMNSILKVDEENKYILIEPGVSFGQIKEYLDKNHPNLRFGYSLSPPHTCVIPNCLLDGLCNLSLKHGAMSSWINGLEAVLADGTIIKTGSCALSDYWFSRAPLPDLTGLFVNMQGTTGIVTKMAVQLWDKQKYQKRFFILAYDIEDTYRLIADLAKLEICDDIGGLSWTTGKMLFDVDNPIYKDENEPSIFIYIDLSANSQKMLDLKEEMINESLKNYHKESFEEKPFDVEQLFNINPEFKKFADFPTDLDFLTSYKGKGLSWIGTYGPYSNLAKGVLLGTEIMKKHGFPPTIVSRPMHSGHFCVLRFIVRFDKKDNKQIADLHDLYFELLEMVLDNGFIPYKTPVWIQKEIEGKMDKGYLNILKKIKDILDPSRILNPGKWDFIK